MNDELKHLRAEITRLQQDRERLESEVSLWRTRYFELLAQSLGTRDPRPPQDPAGDRFHCSMVGSNPSRLIAEGKNPLMLNGSLPFRPPSSSLEPVRGNRHEEHTFRRQMR